MVNELRRRCCALATAIGRFSIPLAGEPSRRAAALI
jgi:hypothetical protein